MADPETIAELLNEEGTYQADGQPWSSWAVTARISALWPHHRYQEWPREYGTYPGYLGGLRDRLEFRLPRGRIGPRTEFVRGGLRLGEPLTAYDGTPAALVRAVKEGPVQIPGDPAKVAARVIDSAAQHPAPLRLVLGSDSYQAVTAALRERLAQVEPQQTDADT
ncbi:hypothetical protein F4561_005757 [Lipingzhangella halophila]|uniref:Uncharacterized protein n=1 Tax=Lipingzhangella halophila TaxID=1783352 RepID=A0A7W7RMR6_9ACTN|nr:hypothetical protein [Lipingzhangella halophila]MBB4934863.1 hypothetical protein [Lipingzhangella halophila]